MRKKTINLISLGCSKNLVDSEKILGQLPKSHFRLMHDASAPADIVIINTCGFIKDAKQESIDTILSFAAARKQGSVKELIVVGCLSQRYKAALPAEIPEVDAWYGVDEPEALFARLKENFSPDLPVRQITTPSHVAYLKVAEGCDRSCSFCAIPLIRGQFQSATVEKVIEEAQYLAGIGVKELLLVAQDLSYYGRDIAKKPLLASLLRELTGIDGIEWIRLHYMYPKNFPTDIIPLMANHPKICNYIDMPFQHINDAVLKSMRRGHNKKETKALINDLRSQIPGLALRTTMLVGYPGETTEAFSELMDFVAESRFERLGVFTYSPEEDTAAFGLGDPVSARQKENRAARLMALQQQISLEINEKRIGKVFKVIIDREESDVFIGRTEYDSLEVDNEVCIEKSPGIAIGQFANIRITGAGEFELFGQLA